MMKAKDVFGIILRSVAVWVFLWGAWQTVAAVAVFPATVQSYLTPRDIPYSSFAYLVYGLPAMVSGVLLLRFANAILSFTYRE